MISRLRTLDLFWLILLVGFLVRIYAFGSIPGGINQDEMASAYDAWSVLHYGIDRNGFHLPMMFVSWGSGMYALSGYVNWPFIALGGLNAITIRLPYLVFGMLSLVLIYKITEQCVNRKAALITMFFLAINPWHIMISRWALEANILPGVFCAAVFVLLYSLKDHKLLPLSALLFALCPYIFGTAYALVPIFLLGAGIALRRLWHVPWKILGMSALVVTVVSIPVVLYFLINQFGWASIELPFMSIPRVTVPRYAEASSVFGGNMSDIFSNLATLWNVLLTQNDGLPWNQIEPFGTQYSFGFFLSLYGIIAAGLTTWKHRCTHPIVFMLLWLFAAIVVGGVHSVNINRINSIYIPLVFFMGYGVYMLTRKNKAALIGMIAISTLYFGAFTHTYFTQYPAVISKTFFEGLGEAITVVSDTTDQSICVTDHANMPYMAVLFFEEIDPHIFVDTVVYSNPNSQFQNASSFGRYTFGLSQCPKDSVGGYVLHASERDQFPPDAYDVEHFHEYSAAIPRSS